MLSASVQIVRIVQIVQKVLEKRVPLLRGCNMGSGDSMDSKELIKIIRSDVTEAKAKGLSAIPVENLFTYFDKLEENVGGSRQALLPEDLEQYKARLAMWQGERVEHFRAVILHGQNALKSAILINGGAAVALLAFIGHLWRPDTVGALRLLAASLVWFVAGVLLDAVSAGSTYLSQYCYALCADSPRGKVYQTAVALHILAILLVLVSYGTFAYGTCLVYRALVK